MKKKTRGIMQDDARKPTIRIQKIYDALAEEQRTGQRVNREILAKKLRVSTKTIQRDIDKIPDYFPGYSTTYDHHDKTYYMMHDSTGEKADFSKNSVQMENFTIFNLLMAKHVLSHFRGSPVFDRLEESVNNIASQLPDKQMKIRMNTIHHAFSSLPIPIRKIDPTIFNIIKECTEHKRVIQITYKPAKGAPSRRAIQPVLMLFHNGDMYTIAWCQKKNAIRIFALSRVTKAVQKEESFNEKDYPEIKKYLDSHFGIFMDGMKNQYNVRLQFSKDQAPFVRERQWYKNQTIEEMKSGGLKLLFTTNHLFEVARWVLSWGPDVKVLAPQELKNNIREQLQKTLKQY